MAIVQSSLQRSAALGRLPEPANSDEMFPDLSSDQKIMAWLFKLSPAARTSQDNKQPPAPSRSSSDPFASNSAFLLERSREPLDDWQTVAHITGHCLDDFLSAEVQLPLTAAEIDHFRRNHREADRLVGRDFLAARTDLPSPVADLYGIYRHRCRLDTEATLFVAQATGSTRVARIMADMLAIGAFAGGHECISHMTMTYSVQAAFDTSDLIDRTADEATRRLSMPIENPSHLLKLSPDEISVLANNIVERHVLSPADFLEKANLLAEARQDVHRLPPMRRLAAALDEGDLPTKKAWVARLCEAYARLFRGWIGNMPSVRALLPREIDAEQRQP